MQSLDISSLRGLGGHHYNYHKKIYENKHLNYIKILIARDPLERMFSLYSHVMRFPSSHQIALAHPSRDLSGMSFGDFALFCAEFSIRDATNMTARFICGNQGDPYRVDRVLEILDSQFRFAYPLQLSNLLYQDLGHYLGAPQKTIDEYALKIRLNKSPTRHRNPQMIAEAAPTILSSNSVDYMIYSHICKRYSNVTNRSNILIKEIADKIRSIREN